MGQTENALCWHIKLAFGEGLFQVEIKLFPYFQTIIKISVAFHTHPLFVLSLEHHQRQTNLFLFLVNRSIHTLHLHTYIPTFLTHFSQINLFGHTAEPSPLSKVDTWLVSLKWVMECVGQQIDGKVITCRSNSARPYSYHQMNYLYK